MIPGLTFIIEIIGNQVPRTFSFELYLNLIQVRGT
jgi:hypothetical protein